MGEGVEAIMIEQGGDKHHHVGHDMEAMLNEHVPKRQRLINSQVGLTGEEGWC